MTSHARHSLKSDAALQNATNASMRGGGRKSKSKHLRRYSYWHGVLGTWAVKWLKSLENQR